MSREKLIFLTNDDCYRSKGFAAAIEVARQFGRVIAIAPDAPQSGMSQAITIYNPLYLRKVREEEGVLVIRKFLKRSFPAYWITCMVLNMQPLKSI